MARLLESAKKWAARHVIILTGQDGSGQVVKEADDEINALIHAWRGLGVRVSFLDWEDESAEHRCCEAMAVLPLLAWSYSKRPSKFKDFLKKISDGGAQPTADLLATRGIVHKQYLIDLDYKALLNNKDIPIVKTFVVIKNEMLDATRHMFRWLNCDEFVVKPAVGGGGDGVERCANATAVEAEVQRRLNEEAVPDMLIQPFMSRVSELGELSFVFVNGTLLHAIRKEPKGWSAHHAQPVTRLDEPPAEAESIARRALEAARKLSVVYEVDGEGRLTRAYTWRADESIYLARVDLLPGNDGRWLVSELELGWPHLFLRAAEGGTAAAAKAVAEALLHRFEGEEKAPKRRRTG
jgi:hypothetical protein